MAKTLIDTNVYLSRWPFRRVHGDETKHLVDGLRAKGVTHAWAGSFDALLHKDIEGVNSRLAEACDEDGDDILIPFGAVNPMLPRWERDVERCAHEYGMAGIRLHPNYHEYTLDNPRFHALLESANASGLAVQIALTMEDERMMHPLMRIAHVDTSPLLDMSLPGPLMLLNAFRAVRGEALARLANRGEVLFDIAWLEGAAGIARHLKLGPAESLSFGSYAPLFYFEAAKLKMAESPLDEAKYQLIASGNAERLLTDAQSR